MDLNEKMTEKANDTTLIGAKDIAEICGVSMSTVWRWKRNEILPRGVQFAGGAARWMRRDIYAFAGIPQMVEANASFHR